jgi:glycerol uptake facilitator-like aquaporin
MTVTRKLCAEALGTAFLLAAVVGSGIMGERLANGNVAIALPANTLATGAALVALIPTFGPISGAHFNPAVGLCDVAGHLLEAARRIRRRSDHRLVCWCGLCPLDVRASAVFGF